MMNHHASMLLVALLCLPVSACVVGKTDLGDLASETTGDDASSSSSEGSGSASYTSGPMDSASTTVGATEASGGDVGAMCFPDPDQPVQGNDVLFPAFSCEELLCVFATDIVPPMDECTDDEDCIGDHPGYFECDVPTGECVFVGEYVSENSMCSAPCETDADCVGVDGTLCETGFSCVPLATLGDACCQPLCVCNDTLEPSVPAEIEQECVTGTSACCQEWPGQGLCPD